MTPIVLAVLPPEVRSHVIADLRTCGAFIAEASCCREADQVLAGKLPVCLIIAGCALPDGSWRSLFTTALRQGLTLKVVVLASEIDGGWIDLLEMGAWEVLSPRCTTSDISRVYRSALSHWQSSN